MHDLKPGPSSSTSASQMNRATDILGVVGVEDGHGECSPRLWNRRQTEDIVRQESSPLLPHNHQFSHAPELRLEVVARRRRELMGMVRNTPEACFEMSLQDIVGEQKHAALQGGRNAPIKDNGLSSNTEGQMKKQKKKRNKDRGQAFQSESLDSRRYLLKMFFPVSPNSRKSSSSHAIISPRPPLDRTDTPKEVRRNSMVYDHPIASPRRPSFDRNKNLTETRRNSTASPRPSFDRTEIPRESRRNSTACDHSIASPRPSFDRTEILKSRRNSTGCNHSVASPIDGTENLIESEWWKKRHAVQVDSKSCGRSSSCGSNSNGSGHTDGSVTPGCWPYFNTRKSRMK